MTRRTEQTGFSFSDALSLCLPCAPSSSLYVFLPLSVSDNLPLPPSLPLSLSFSLSTEEGGTLLGRGCAAAAAAGTVCGRGCGVARACAQACGEGGKEDEKEEEGGQGEGEEEALMGGLLLVKGSLPNPPFSQG